MTGMPMPPRKMSAASVSSVSASVGKPTGAVGDPAKRSKLALVKAETEWNRA